MEPENGDTRIILHRLDGLSKQLESLQEDFKNHVHQGGGRLAELQKQTALLQQADVNIRKELKRIEKDVGTDKTITRIFSAVAGLLALIAAAFGIRN